MTRERDQRDHRGITRALSAMTRILGTTPARHPNDSSGSMHSSIVDCAIYVHGRRKPGTWNYAEALDMVRRDPDAFLWLGLHQPSADELEDIAETFGLHELPVEDALQGYQRPKIERYPAMTFAALRTTRYVEHGELTETSEIVETGHVMLFIGRDFVITVRHGAPSELKSLRADLESNPEQLAEGPWAVAHRIYDRIVDSYVATAAQIEIDIDQLEDSVFATDRQGSIQRIYQFKRELVEFKRAVLPLQRPVADIAGGHIADVPVELKLYFRDVNDNLSRTVDQVHLVRRPAQLDPPSAARPGHRRPERRHAQDRGLGRYRGRLDRGRRHLRYELRVHAGTALAVRLSGGARPQPGRVDHPVPPVPQVRLALAASPGRPRAVAETPRQQTRQQTGRNDRSDPFPGYRPVSFVTSSYCCWRPFLFGGIAFGVASPLPSLASVDFDDGLAPRRPAASLSFASALSAM